MDVASLGVELYLDDSKLDAQAKAAVAKVVAELNKIPKAQVDVQTNAPAATKQVQDLNSALKSVVGTKTVNLNVNTSGAQSKIDAIKNSIADLQRKGYYNLAGGAALTGAITAPVVGLGVAAVKQAGDFQDTMQHLPALTEITRNEVGNLSKAVLELSSDPKIKQGPTELADALYFVASSGLKGGDAMNVLRQSALGATAGLGDTKVVADTVTSVLNAYGLSADKARRVTDTLTEAVRYGKGEASAYAAAFPKVISLAAQAGVSFEEVAAQMASATRVGLTPSESATALRQVFNNLIDPSEKAKKAMKEMKTSVDEVRESLRDKGLFNTLKDLQERTGGRIGPITELFGSVRALTSFLSTTGQGTLDDYKKTLDGIQAASGSTERAAGTSMETLNAQFEKLKATVQRVAIEFGTNGIPKVTELVELIGQKLPAALQATISGWNALSDGEKKVLTDLAAILLLAGPLKMMLGTIQILASSIGTIGIGTAGAATGGLGILKLLSTLKQIPALIATFQAGGGIAAALGSAASVGVLGTALAGLVITAEALGVAYEILGIKYYNWRAAMDDAEVHTNNAKVATDSYVKSLNGALKYASGSATAKNGLTKLRDDAQAAGMDTQKLLKTLHDATEEKLVVGSDMHLDPLARALALDEIQRFMNDAQAKLRELGITVKVIKEAETPTASGAFVSSITDADRAARYAAAGVDVPKAPHEPMAGKGAPVTQDERDAYQRKLAASDARVRKLEQDLADENQRKSGYATGSKGTSSEPVGGIAAMKDSEVRKAYADLVKKAKAGTLTGEEKQYGRDLFAETQARQQKIADAWKKQQADAKDAAAQQKEKAQGILDENARRQSNLDEKAMNEKAQMWQSFGAIVDQAAGGVDAFGEKTKRAQIEAQLLKGKFADIPPYLKEAVKQMGDVQDSMQRMVAFRDALRGPLDAAFSGLVKGGYDTSAFTAGVRNAEKLLGLEKEIANRKAQGAAAQKLLGDEVKRQVDHYKTAAEQTAESRRPSAGIYAGDIPALRAKAPRSYLMPNNGVPGLQDPVVSPMDISSWKRIGEHKNVVSAAKKSSDDTKRAVAGDALMARLLGVQLPPGQIVTDRGMLPGETRGNQFALQSVLMNAKLMKEVADQYKSKGWNLSGAIAELQKRMAGADLSESVGGIIRDFGKQTRLVGQENNPIAELFDDWAQDSKTEASSKIFHTALAMRMGLVRAQMELSTREIASEANKASIVRRAVDPNALGADQDRQRFEAQLRVAENYKSDIVGMRQAADELEKNGMIAQAHGKRQLANKTVSDRMGPQMREYDQQKQADALLEAGRATREYTNQLGSLNQQRDKLGAMAGQPEAKISESLQQIADFESQVGQLTEKYGDLRGRYMARDYADRQAQIRQVQRSIDLQKEWQSLTNDATNSNAQASSISGAMTHEAQKALEMLKYKQSITDKYGNVDAGLMGAKSDDIDAQNRLQAQQSVASSLQELTKTMATLGDQTGIAALSFDLYSGALQSADQAQKDMLLSSTKTLELRKFQLDADGEVLQSQQQLAESYATTARQRLAIEFGYQNKQRDMRRGTAPDANTQGIWDAEDATTSKKQGDLLDLAALQDKVSMMRDAISNGIQTGFEQGVGKGIKAFGENLRHQVEQRLTATATNSVLDLLHLGQKNLGNPSKIPGASPGWMDTFSSFKPQSGGGVVDKFVAAMTGQGKGQVFEGAVFKNPNFQGGGIPSLSRGGAGSSPSIEQGAIGLVTAWFSGGGHKTSPTGGFTGSGVSLSGGHGV